MKMHRFLVTMEALKRGSGAVTCAYYRIHNHMMMSSRIPRAARQGLKLRHAHKRGVVAQKRHMNNYKNASN